MNQRRDQLVEAHLDLVRQLAVRVARRLPPSFELDDLVQQGCLGLLQAADRYDPDLNSSFDAYARPRIKGAMLDSIRRRHWINGLLLEMKEPSRTEGETSHHAGHRYEIRYAA